MTSKLPGGVGTAYQDTFASDNLPSAETLSKIDFSGTPELATYPDHMNVATELLDKAVAEGFGDNPVLHLAATTWTYHELLDRANRVAEVLTEDCGLVTGNRVLLRAPNTPMLVAAWFGVQKAGGICVATMPLLRARELQYVIEKAQVSIALCDIELAEEMVGALELTDSITHTFYFSKTGTGGEAATLETAGDGKSGQFETANTAADDVALIAFTSGTTGKPKGAVNFHRDVMASADTFARYVGKITPDDIITGTPPLAFTFGLGGILIFPMLFRASTRFLESPLPNDILETIQQYKITQIYSAPTAFRAMADIAGDYDISSLRQGVSAGETLPKATWEAFRKATGIRLIDGLGSTEMFQIFISASPEEMRPGFTGKAIPGYCARVVDDSGNEVPPGTPGQLAVQGPTGCKYLDDPDRQPVYVKDGWNYPGDIYEMDEDGYFKYVARADDMIISSGYNISGPEVESVLLEHEAVAECAVIASPDPQRGNIVKAIIVLRTGFDGTNDLIKTLQDFAKKEIAPYKYPRAIAFIEELPKTQTGKLQRYRLRDLETS
ncbi:MAG TPA: AMP-binding protein [Rhodospirillales bacterium]|nr:AMP-binding protein [Rhodospirillales bacterium]